MWSDLILFFFFFDILSTSGKYVGSRPIKLRKSNWKNRNIDEVKKRQKEKDVLLGKRRWLRFFIVWFDDELTPQFTVFWHAPE